MPNVDWNTLHRWCAVLAVCLTAAASAEAQSGTQNKKTLTFASTPNATATFDAVSALGDTITVFIELSRDGNAVPALTVADVNGVDFVLTRGAPGPGVPSVTIDITDVGGASFVDAATFPPAGSRTIIFDQVDPAINPLLYRLSIAAGAIPAESWTLQIVNVPVAAPPIRAILALGPQTTSAFTNLIPVAPATGGGILATVAVTSPTTGSAVFTATTVPASPAGVTFHWIPEGDSIAAQQSISADGKTLTYTLQACSCCCRSITYRFEARQGATVLASTRGVFKQCDLNCGGGPPFKCPPWKFWIEIAPYLYPPTPWPGPWPPCLSCPYIGFGAQIRDRIGVRLGGSFGRVDDQFTEDTGRMFLMEGDLLFDVVPRTERRPSMSFSIGGGYFGVTDLPSADRSTFIAPGVTFRMPMGGKWSVEATMKDYMVTEMNDVGTNHSFGARFGVTWQFGEPRPGATTARK